MNHERVRELLALRLYGEADPAEAELIAEHLRGCSSCALFARDLECGLGRARALREQIAGEDLPVGWDASLADATASLRRAGWLRESLLVGSGLAAGVLAMLAWATLERPAPASVASADPDAPAFLRFQQASPPPLATGGGPAVRYLSWQAK